MSARAALLALCAAALLAACATVPERVPAPPWLQAVPSDRDYLYGRGSGTTLDEAQQRSRAELAHLFETRVRDARWDYTQAADGRVSARLTRALASETRRVLHGSEIAAAWQDPADGRHYALARLPRAAAATQIRAQLGRLEARARDLDTQAGRATDPLHALALLAQGRATQAEWLPLARDLAILESADALPAPPDWRFEARLREGLAALVVGLHAAPPALAGALGDGARAAGLARVGALANPAAALLALSAVLVEEPPLHEQGWHWQRAQLSLTLWAAGEPARTRRWALKQAGATPESAAQRVRAEAEGLLRREVEGLLLGSP